jgi:hypothetical protein
MTFVSLMTKLLEQVSSYIKLEAKLTVTYIAYLVSNVRRSTANSYRCLVSFIHSEI